MDQQQQQEDVDDVQDRMLSRGSESQNCNENANLEGDQEDCDSSMALFSWGQNAYGELGHGNTEIKSEPQIVEFAKTHRLKIAQIVGGNEHTAILTTNGTVYTCGYNDSGQCGVGSTGRVDSLKEVEMLKNKNVVQLYSANGCEHLLAITADGLLYSWGYNSRGQLGHNMASHISSPKLVDALAVKRVVKVACSYYHTVLTTDEELVYAMGRNDYGQLGLPDTRDHISPELVNSLPKDHILSIACGQYHTVFSIEGHGLFSCGKNDYGQLGTPGEGTEPRHSPSPVASPLNGSSVTISQVACGYYHTIALTNNGIAFGWGRNDYGQLGLGEKESRTPHRIEGLPSDNIVQITCGCYHTLLLTEDGNVFAQGRNNHGQLGTKSDVDTPVPVMIEGLEDYHVIQVAAGFYHSLCLTGTPIDNNKPPVSTLSKDLAGMVNNPARADVIFIVEEREIFAHRCIIMARCEPLDIMLNGPMKESNELKIPLPDHRYDVILALLEFLYTDQVSQLDPTVDVEFALDLLAVADQFLVNRLKSLCEIAIQKSINAKNVAVMFKTADARQASALRKRCFDYMQRNFGKVIGTEGFTSLPRELLREVLFAAHEKGVSIRL